MVVMVKIGGVINKDKVFVAVCAVGTVTSVTVITTDAKVPVTVGVPLI